MTDGIVPATDTRPVRACCDTQVGNPHEPWCDVALFERQKSAAEQQRDRLLAQVRSHQAEKSHGVTANMELSDQALYDLAAAIDKEFEQ